MIFFEKQIQNNVLRLLYVGIISLSMYITYYTMYYVKLFNNYIPTYNISEVLFKIKINI